jgi:hypothetical protein
MQRWFEIALILVALVIIIAIIRGRDAGTSPDDDD